MLHELPERSCQALDDRYPSHAAEVVCNRDGLEWFSCRKHAPESVKVVRLRAWYIMHGLLARSDRVTPTQLAVLARAVARPGGHAMPTPGLGGAAQGAVLGALERRGLIAGDIPTITDKGRATVEDWQQEGTV